MTLSGIEPATFRFVAQHLNLCATVVPRRNMYTYYYRKRQLSNIKYLCINNINTARYLQPCSPLQVFHVVSHIDTLQMETLVKAFKVALLLSFLLALPG